MFLSPPTFNYRRDTLESWPEDWFFEPTRSYGFTVHLGTRFGSGGARVYALAGARRLEATFSTDYTGCFNTTLCTEDEFVTGTNVHDEDFIGWAAGVGLEKTLGSTAIRGEVRYTDYGGTGRVTPFEALAITVPLALEASLHYSRRSRFDRQRA